MHESVFRFMHRVCGGPRCRSPTPRSSRPCGCSNWRRSTSARPPSASTCWTAPTPTSSLRREGVHQDRPPRPQPGGGRRQDRGRPRRARSSTSASAPRRSPWWRRRPASEDLVPFARAMDAAAGRDRHRLHRRLHRLRPQGLLQRRRGAAGVDPRGPGRGAGLLLGLPRDDEAGINMDATAVRPGSSSTPRS